ncbi:DUF1304 domain-containing protein [Prevotella falsenii]|uniref:DUF1304 domain-containing protein n=1 Tax=Prevotella falsenii TaxID=515414 RepID=UPI000468EBB6|nr:DUF1304 family protein [Prevotella falsenii]
MHIVTIVSATFVALEFLYIMYLETFATTSKRTSEVFGLTKEELSQPSLARLFQNQGVYNGLIGLLLLAALYVFPDRRCVVFLLIYCVGVAAYGGYSAGWRIFLKQGTLPLLSLVSCFLF